MSPPRRAGERKQDKDEGVLLRSTGTDSRTGTRGFSA